MLKVRCASQCGALIFSTRAERSTYLNRILTRHLATHSKTTKKTQLWNLKGKTGFRLLSSRNDSAADAMVRKIQFLIYFKKIVNFPPKVNLSPRLYSQPLPSESCTSYSKQPPLQPRWARDRLRSLGVKICPTSISAPPADHHRTPTFALYNLVYVTCCVTFLVKLLLSVAFCSI